jgi:hypothetical protein
MFPAVSVMTVPQLFTTPAIGVRSGNSLYEWVSLRVGGLAGWERSGRLQPMVA